MEIHEQRQGAVTILKPQGPLVSDDAELVKSRAHEMAASSLGRVALDVSAVPFVDSRGLEVLVELADELENSGQSLKLCGANETIREVLDLTGLATRFEHFEDTTAAVRSFL